MVKIIRRYDIGTKVRVERGEVELIVDHNGGQKARVKSASYLDEIYNRKYINVDQNEAGKRFYRDWYCGVQTRDGVGTMVYNVRPSKNNGGRKESEYTERQMQYWKDYHDAVKSLEGLGSHVVHGVCCYNNTLKEIEDKLRLPRKFGITRLKESLDTLAVHYGIVQRK